MAFWRPDLTSLVGGHDKAAVDATQPARERQQTTLASVLLTEWPQPDVFDRPKTVSLAPRKCRVQFSYRAFEKAVENLLRDPFARS
jgi:hypothetical protein